MTDIEQRAHDLAILYTRIRFEEKSKKPGYAFDVDDFAATYQDAFDYLKGRVE